MPYSLEVEINNGFWSTNSKNHFGERLPKNQCSNFQSFLVLKWSSWDLSNGMSLWQTGESVCNFVGYFSSQATSRSVVQMFITGHTVNESTVHGHAFSGLSETNSESCTFAVQRLPGLEGTSRVNDFLSATRAKDFMTSDVLPTPFLALYQIALLMVTRHWKKDSPLAISMGNFFFFLPFTLCLPWRQCQAAPQACLSLGEGRWHTVPNSKVIA